MNNANNKGQCYLCNQDANIYNCPDKDQFKIECKLCGKYYLDGVCNRIENYFNKEQKRWARSYLSDCKLKGIEPEIITEFLIKDK